MPITARQRAYRQTIGHFATGVAVVTAQGADGPVGMTANALCSLSLDPLLLLVCIDNSARTLAPIRATGRFAVNVLCRAQRPLADAFASKEHKPSHFEHTPWRDHQGVPVLEESLAWLVCDLRELHPGGDHTIGIGAVTDMAHDEHGTPLVWYRGGYVELGAAGP
ncbi:MAG TPA: flavin reductase family protein [Solirubrobacteraceae bacterium]|jgi:flavin reductase (DIM6/NTAB) family NADH-FMN oxidoreductase RutF|nr:flavin reductase family protein [Solirubrobacteraceae bacterium]